MSPKEILEDFIVYTLLQYEELASSLGFFCNQEEAVLIFEIEEEFKYQDFIRQELTLDEFKVKENQTASLEILTDLISDYEISKLINYLNQNFKQEFPDNCDEKGNTIGGNISINITKNILEENFKDYISLHRINPSIYVSLLSQLIIKDSRISLKIVPEEIIAVSKILPEKLRQDYLDDRLDYFKKELFKNIEKFPFQLEGFFDEKGVYIDYDLTLRKWLEISKTFKVYDEVFRAPETSKSYIQLQSLYYKVYGESLSPIEGTTREELNKSLKDILRVHSNLVKFLQKKSFSVNEIKAIFNILSDNEYSSLNIRTIEIRQVELFRFCYLFFIFDYFKSEEGLDFSSETEFNKIYLKLPDKDLKNRNNQFKKYYSHIDGPVRNKHYPFRNVSNTIRKIEDRLKIPKEKLKEITLQNFF